MSILLDDVLMILQLILTMLAHELGHVLAARYFGVPVRKLGLGRLGPYVRRARTTGWPEVSICLAGAAANLALAIAFWNADHWFAVCNFTFAWVNLLPIANSDGTHALEAFRELRWAQLVERVGKGRMYGSL
jgi:Zn-dependent protease